MPRRIVPCFFGAAVLVPSAVGPNSASDNDGRVATAVTTSAVLVAAAKSEGTSKRALSSGVTSSPVTSWALVTLSILLHSPVVVVVMTLMGNPSFTSPATRVSNVSMQAAGSTAGGGAAACVGRTQTDCSGRSTYHASISILSGDLSHAVALDCLMTSVLIRRASRPNIGCRSSVSVNVVVI